MKQNFIVSIIINNYNYARYLPDAIDSALGQSYPYTEVIVVDDGSTDGSQEVLEKYKNVIKTCTKSNGGQGSAFNAGFKMCHGQIIIFLDSDDTLLPQACQVITETFALYNITKAHWPSYVIDENGIRTGELTPGQTLPQGDLLKQTVALGPNAYLSSPTTGNAWSRDYLKTILPMPEEAFRISADNYLCMLAPVYGEIKTIAQPLTQYRLHGKNNFRGKVLDEPLLLSKVERFDTSCEIIEKHLSSLGIEYDTENWIRNSWLKKLQQSLKDIKSIVPVETKFMLADDNQWQMEDEIAGRQIIPFKEHNNKYWGPPADDLDAIAEIKRQVSNGARFLFFAWPAFWWLEHYQQLVEYLRNEYTCVIADERLVGYKLANIN